MMRKQHIPMAAIALVLLVGLAGSGFCQDRDKEKKAEPYQITLIKEIAHTPVKNQARTGTCWDFATTSFVESEAMRLGAEALNLSEMYTVRITYPLKADNYVRLHGNATFGQGALSHDVMDRIRNYGAVPESVFDGLRLGNTYHDHSEMFQVMEGYLKVIAGSRKPSIRWREGFEDILDAYLGDPPSSFTYKGKNYTPKSFAKEVVKINPDDYLEFTSFTNTPFYQKCRLQVPDNWCYYDDYYNLPLDKLEALVDYALENGYSVAWDGDVSEPFFDTRNLGLALLVERRPRGEITEPIKEKEVTQELRQEEFDDFSTTDDHLMHIVGIGEDQNGNKYYYIKNSGGDERARDGYLYMSKPYFRMKTTGIMVHRDAIPSDLKEKLGL